MESSYNEQNPIFKIEISLCDLSDINSYDVEETYKNELNMLFKILAFKKFHFLDHENFITFN